MTDLFNYEDEKICPNCQGLGKIKKSGELLTPKVNMDEMKIYELSVEEFKKLMVECYEMLEKRKLDTSMEEYKRLTSKTLAYSPITLKGGYCEIGF